MNFFLLWNVFQQNYFITPTDLWRHFIVFFMSCSSILLLVYVHLKCTNEWNFFHRIHLQFSLYARNELKIASRKRSSRKCKLKKSIVCFSSAVVWRSTPHRTERQFVFHQQKLKKSTNKSNSRSQLWETTMAKAYIQIEYQIQKTWDMQTATMEKFGWKFDLILFLLAHWY